MYAALAIARAMLVSAVALAHPSHAEAAGCSPLLPTSDTMERLRPITAEDIASLRDIGVDGASWSEAGTLAISPDGRSVAFQLRRGDAANNRYCLEMLVVDLRPGARPIVIDRGGDYLRVAFDFRGKASFPTGNPLPIEPRWSPDGRWIVFLKRENGITQVWRAGPGIPASRITSSPADVERVAFSADGKSIIYSARPGLRKAQTDIDREGLHGFRYDGRFSPMSANRPFAPSAIPTEAFAQDLLSSSIRPATEIEKSRLSEVSDAVGRPGFSDTSLSPNGRRARRQRIGMLLPTYGLFAQDSRGRETRCRADSCEGRISLPWWSADGRKLFYLRREGWALSSTGLYEWQPGHGQPRRTYITDDVLSACQPVSGSLLCLRERATTPRQIVMLNPLTRTMTTVFDPNPELRGLQMGETRTLHQMNSFGIETSAHLVLPVGYKHGTRYPLIVVGYSDNGFLRGGTGDEYPIQAFAARGYAVISYNKPQMLGLKGQPRDWFEVERDNLKDFQDRRSMLSSIEVAVRSAIDQGVADPKRLGLTGFSDGVSTAQYALLHSSLFAAVALSHGTWEANYPLFVGPEAMKDFEAATYPGLMDDRARFWKEFSLRPNAASIDVPILMQVPDDEYLSDLEGFTALRDKEKPVDLFVYPDEHHVKWQPAHRLAIYRRNLDWFDFWLRDVRSSSPDRQADLAHWDMLKAQHSRRSIQSGRSSQ